MKSALGRFFCARMWFSVLRSHAVLNRLGGRSLGRYEAPAHCAHVMTSLSGAVQSWRNKKRVVQLCLLYSSAPTCRDGEPQC
jgi:hypothetical protein